MDIKAHLLERGLDPQHYTVSWDDETATFALFNLSGQWVGYQQYRPGAPKSGANDPKLGRYYTYARNKTAVWGLETYHWRTDVLFVTEGIFDACKLHNLQLPAIAVLTNNPRSLRPWIGSLPRHTIAICDNDAAGAVLSKLCDRAFSCPTGKDLGDMTQQQVIDFIEENCSNIINDLEFDI